jgi:CRISPR/Cas system-associated endonuclease/helicase Cas3
MSAPRYDLIRADVDDLHAKYFAKSLDIKKSHKNFVKGLNKAFSPLTESTAFSYAKAAYHANIVHIEQYFNVEKNRCHYGVLCINAIFFG